MKVRELISELMHADQEALVIIQKDPEGNGYSPLSDWSEGGYDADSPYSGEFCFLELTPELEKEGYTEDDVNSEAVKAIFLCPIN